MAEWSKAHAWKVCIRQKRIVGSNPTRSATNPQHQSLTPGNCRKPADQADLRPPFRHWPISLPGFHAFVGAAVPARLRADSARSGFPAVQGIGREFETKTASAA